MADLLIFGLADIDSLPNGLTVVGEWFNISAQLREYFSEFLSAQIRSWIFLR
jgi:hypothetical protein